MTHEKPHLLDGTCDCPCDECTTLDGRCLCPDCDRACGCSHPEPKPAAKVWVITESAGYGCGDVLRAVCSTPEKATEWIAGKCGCDKRHDLWSASTPAELRSPVPGTAPEEFEAWRKKWRAWREQYCSSLYDVEDWEVDT